MPLDQPMSRRIFLRRGALLSSAVLSGAIGPALFFRRDAEAAIMGIGQELRNVLNEETVNRILIEALRRGGLCGGLRRAALSHAHRARRRQDRLGHVRIPARRRSARRAPDPGRLRLHGRHQLQRASRCRPRVLERGGEPEPGHPHRRDAAAPRRSVHAAPSRSPDGRGGQVRHRAAHGRGRARGRSPHRLGRVVYQDEVRDLLIGTSDGAFILDRQYLLSATCAPRRSRGTSGGSGTAPSAGASTRST